MVKPVVIGCRTDNFVEEQLREFQKHQPFGMIIFSEPFKKGPDAVHHVIGQFKSACPQAKIFIDAEGGQVNRLKPQFGFGWPDIPDARSFAELAITDLEAARQAIFLNAQLIAKGLAEFGINVNCAPVVDLVHADVLSKNTNDGKPHATAASLYRRSFGHDADIVTECAKAFMDGLESMGICGVVKHVPGYGRVSADPHYAQSGIETSLEELTKTDFVPFRNLQNTRAMMTGHVLYQDIDPDFCSTLSPKVMNVIRNDIGFNGILIADSIEMNAIWPEGFSKTEKDYFGMGLPLPGTLEFLTGKALGAGCDLVMHSDCSRDFAHTVEILDAAPNLDDEKLTWLLEKLTI